MPGGSVPPALPAGGRAVPDRDAAGARSAGAGRRVTAGRGPARSREAPARPRSLGAPGELLELARAVYLDERFDPAAAARTVVEAARRAGEAAAGAGSEEAEGTAREREQRAKRIARGAEREEILGSLELLAGWYRDVLAASLGALAVVLNGDRASELAEDGARVAAPAAEQAVEAVLETQRRFDLNVGPALALEALFIRLRRTAGRAAASRGMQP